MERPLRYRPDGSDFVISNGEARYNRPLYAAGTAFRIDCGDRPEFAVNLPRKAGVLRLGVGGASPRWLHDATDVEMRYRPGSVVYTIRDDAWGDATVTVTVLPLRERQGAIWRIETSGPLPGELTWSFTGGSKRSANARNGDIIAGIDPGTIMPPTADEVVGNTVTLMGSVSRYTNRAGVFDFVSEPVAAFGATEFSAWANVPDSAKWVATSEGDAPVAQGVVTLVPQRPAFLGLFVAEADAEPTQTELAALWASTEKARGALVTRVEIDTPDPFINAAAGALVVAADAVWQAPNVMHGAIAWRMPLLGWRGPGALDPLGWHERFRAYARYWIAQQNVDPASFPEEPRADPAKNLATDDWRALQGYGSIPARHYDMALGFVDLLLRHLNWTGDVEFAREVWPFLERHLAWEKRCFDRDGLYEAYAAIWASDALTYNGGGTAHASAYNYWHRVMAARLAVLVGADPAPHRAEAERIRAAMDARLWMEGEGTFAEYQEWAGLQRPHPAAALWTFYHVIDSQVASPNQTWQMTETLARRAVRIPVLGVEVPAGGWMLPTSNWQPYEWSLNNVVPSENAHTALALWQAGRADLAWPLWRGTLLDAMYLGLSPGNIPNLSHYDVHRRETYRDFADPIGTFSRAIVEGLFGVRPDAMEDTLTLAPGFPADWEHARLRTPDFDWKYQRAGAVDQWSFASTLAGMDSVHLRVPARGTELVSVSVNERRLASLPVLTTDPKGDAWCEMQLPLGSELQVTMTWAGERARALEEGPHEAEARTVIGLGDLPAGLNWEPVELAAVFNDRVKQIFSHDYLSPRSPYVSLSLPKQGIGSWSDFKAQAELDDGGIGGMLELPNGGILQLAEPGRAANVAFVSWWDNFPQLLSVPLVGRARHVLVLVAGSTGPMHSRIDNGEIVVTYTDGSTAVLPLHNPTTWWPIERDYVIDDYAFRRGAPVPWRVALATRTVYLPDGQGGHPAGGAATVLNLPLDSQKELKSLTVRALSTEVVVGLLAASLAR